MENDLCFVLTNRNLMDLWDFEYLCYLYVKKLNLGSKIGTIDFN